ncbi:hypothetical protein D8B26_007452 [Coccidioides posadasii str. Silveira]|uniref:Uncharacterized protein n=2 Tax=Coccidioides posadasii TaxID=199306 RepID=E9CVA5_COCPS|nr:conserved hypothetical protein [Coccidioides posadasii str. Silveira]KMM71650.1 hypothetical protein CPAG_07953 [Coccidioides posadasii RMSCC 3488]QVM12834.1 hypothetical protein D8B26_007452 [Coccidioides posadasii str. Silveira]
MDKWTRIRNKEAPQPQNGSFSKPPSFSSKLMGRMSSLHTNLYSRYARLSTAVPTRRAESSAHASSVLESPLDQHRPANHSQWGNLGPASKISNTLKLAE